MKQGQNLETLVDTYYQDVLSLTDLCEQYLALGANMTMREIVERCKTLSKQFPKGQDDNDSAFEAKAYEGYIPSFRERLSYEHGELIEHSIRNTAGILEAFMSEEQKTLAERAQFIAALEDGHGDTSRYLTKLPPVLETAAQAAEAYQHKIKPEEQEKYVQFRQVLVQMIGTLVRVNASHLAIRQHLGFKDDPAVAMLDDELMEPPPP